MPSPRVWRVAHNLLVHPLMELLPVRWGNRLHAWTGERAFAQEEQAAEADIAELVDLVRKREGAHTFCKEQKNGGRYFGCPACRADLELDEKLHALLRKAA